MNLDFFEILKHTEDTRIYDANFSIWFVNIFLFEIKNLLGTQILYKAKKYRPKQEWIDYLRPACRALAFVYDPSFDQVEWQLILPL